MLKEKNAKLIQNLNELIKNYSRHDGIRRIVTDEFKNRNMRAIAAVNILNERLLLSSLDIDTNKDLIALFVFALGMFKAFSVYKDEEGFEDVVVEEIDPEKYFSEIEVENLKEYKQEDVDVKDNVITFKPFIQVEEGHWVGPISSKQLFEIDSLNDLVYNFNTQREPVIDIYGLKRIKIDRKKVIEIRNRVLSGKQFSDAISINVLHDNVTDEVHYNPKTMELKIGSGTMNIFDGFHRKTGVCLAMLQNPDLEFNLILNITNWSENKAQEAMVQINKQKPINTDYINKLDTSKMGNIVVDAIREIKTSEFAGAIKDLDTELKYEGMTTKIIMATTIDEVYEDKLETKILVPKIAKHIAIVIDTIIGIFPKEFLINSKETKEISFINHKNMFAGYIVLSKKLFNEKDPLDEKEIEESLANALMNVNFSMNNTFWKDIGLTDSKMNLSTRKNLYEFFNALL